MGPVDLVWLVVSVGVGAFLGAFFLCRICFLRGFLGFIVPYDYQRRLYSNWCYKGSKEIVS